MRPLIAAATWACMGVALAPALLVPHAQFLAQAKVDFSQMFDPRDQGERAIYGKTRIRRYVGCKQDDQGNIYRGSHDADGRLHGWAYLSRSTAHGQAEYEGEWVHGKKHGEGVFIDTTGLRTVAQFRDNTASGLGAAEYVAAPKGGIAFEYHGELEGGLQHGQGVIVIGKAMYMGTFERNQRSGLGVVHFEDSEYRGEVARGEMHGAGVYNSSQFEYSGEFAAGMQHGFGRLEVFETGKVYEGFWQQGQRHGCGMESSPGYLWGRRMWVGHFNDGRQAKADSGCAEDMRTRVGDAVQSAVESADSAVEAAESAFELSKRITARVAKKLDELNADIREQRKIRDDGGMGNPHFASQTEAAAMVGGDSSGSGGGGDDDDNNGASGSRDGGTGESGNNNDAVAPNAAGDDSSIGGQAPRTTTPPPSPTATGVAAEAEVEVGADGSTINRR